MRRMRCPGSAGCSTWSTRSCSPPRWRIAGCAGELSAISCQPTTELVILVPCPIDVRGDHLVRAVAGGELRADMSEATITLNSQDEAVVLFGHRDQLQREIKTALGVQLTARGKIITAKGTDEQLAQAERVFGQLRHLIAQQGSLSSEDVRTVLEIVQTGGAPIEGATPPAPGAEFTGRYTRPRTDGQARYVRAMRDNDLTLCVGPAGSGKTYLGVAMAVSMLRQGQVKKIVLVRPAVEAGERLGFLPGDMVAKVNPYLRPLFDALNDMMDHEQVRRYMDNDIIEIVPLAYMRGRTLNHAAIILDEGQNTTDSQKK